MFQNPFKGLIKLDYLLIGLLLLIAVGNWLLDPYKTTVKEYLTDWPPYVTYIVLAALVNVVVAFIAIKISGDRYETWWRGKQPQSAWSTAYLETIEKQERNNKWTHAAMSIWLISLIVSFVLLGFVIVTNLLFTQTINMFIIYLAAYSLGRAFLKIGNLKWK